MKFSIVTPTYNSEQFLAGTIKSVLTQKGDFTIEHLIMDNCSRDATIEIVKNYQRMIGSGECGIGCNGVELTYYHEKDHGMYDAVNKGFSRATGDIYAWINADDVYLPDAFDIIARSFEISAEIQWIKGITSYIDESSALYERGRCFLYDRTWLGKGVYGRDAYFVQQDSVFWRAGLWKTAGGIDPRFKRAGDYALWVSFSRHAPLYSVNAPVSCFRKVRGQISQDLAAYRKECATVPIDDPYGLVRRAVIRIFFRLADIIRLPALWKPVYRLLFGNQRFLLIDPTGNKQAVLQELAFYEAGI
jgi:glycosyltransferase involved in cell wall biosynthesis